MSKNICALCLAAVLTSVSTVALVVAHSTFNMVAGNITDPQGAGIAGASVTLYERDNLNERDNRVRLHAVTDEPGAFRCERLAPGEYILEAEARGVARLAKSVRVEPGATVTVDVSLSLAGVIEQVVVTASGTAQPVDEVSKAVTVIGANEIERRGEITIAEALRRTPGLRVRESNGPGSLTTISTRGLRNEDTAVLIDGLRFRDTSASFHL